MSDLGKLQGIESEIPPVITPDQNDLADRFSNGGETLVQKVRRRLNGALAPALVIGAAAAMFSGVGYISYLEGKRTDENHRMLDKMRENDLKSFGSQGTVAEVHGPRFASKFQCVLIREDGEKILAHFDMDLPVVEGEIWEVKYDPLQDLNVLTKKVEKE